MLSPKVMAKVRTGTVGSRAPAPSAPSSPARWPSWKTQTRAPKVAPRLRTFMTMALTGTTTEPVNRNSSTKVASTTRATARGRRSRMVAW